MYTTDVRKHSHLPCRHVDVVKREYKCFMMHTAYPDLLTYLLTY